jgi:hypothetical protein
MISLASHVIEFSEIRDPWSLALFNHQEMQVWGEDTWKHDCQTKIPAGSFQKGLGICSDKPSWAELPEKYTLKWRFLQALLWFHLFFSVWNVPEKQCKVMDACSCL